MILKASCGVLSVLVARTGSSDRVADYVERLPLGKSAVFYYTFLFRIPSGGHNQGVRICAARPRYIAIYYIAEQVS